MLYFVLTMPSCTYSTNNQWKVVTDQAVNNTNWQH